MGGCFKKYATIKLGAWGMAQKEKVRNIFQNFDVVVIQVDF